MSAAADTIRTGIADGYNEDGTDYACSAETRCGSCVGCEAEAALDALVAAAAAAEQERDEWRRMADDHLATIRARLSDYTRERDRAEAAEQERDEAVEKLGWFERTRWVVRLKEERERAEAAVARADRLEQALRELPDEELCIELRADAMAILGADARTVKAVELRQVAAQLRDLLTAVMNARAALASPAPDRTEAE